MVEESSTYRSNSDTHTSYKSQSDTHTQFSGEGGMDFVDPNISRIISAFGIDIQAQLQVLYTAWKMPSLIFALQRSETDSTSH